MPGRPADRRKDETRAGSSCAAWRQCNAFWQDDAKAMAASAAAYDQLWSKAILSAPLLDRHRNPAGARRKERTQRWADPPPGIFPGTSPPPGRPACRYRLSGPDTAPHFARV